MNDKATPAFRGLLVSPPLTRTIPYGLTPDQLEFDPATVDVAPSGDDIGHLLDETLTEQGLSLRVIEAALALYEHQCHSTTYDFTDRCGLFAASLDTALIWERG